MYPKHLHGSSDNVFIRGRWLLHNGCGKVAGIDFHITPIHLLLKVSIIDKNHQSTYPSLTQTVVGCEDGRFAFVLLCKRKIILKKTAVGERKHENRPQFGCGLQFF